VEVLDKGEARTDSPKATRARAAKTLEKRDLMMKSSTTCPSPFLPQVTCISKAV
jgi:hypothetical protein